MLALTLVMLSLPGQIGSPRGVHLLDDAPLLAQAPPLVPLEPGASDAQVSVQQLQVDLDALKKARPSIGGGIALVTTGGGVAALGALYLALSASLGAPIVIIYVGAALLAVGLPLAVIGIWLLYNRLEDRTRIDAETRVLKEQLRQRQRLEQPVPQLRPIFPPAEGGPPPQVLRGPDASMLLLRFD